ncbi:MAG: hypothetical protein K6B64_05580 [Acholeplasmatales bacterium]|nr:hypothetical protein [Acholeplasmatales bacterium]
MTKNKLRQMATATMAGALAIGLASCRGATDNTGTLNVNETYASVGDFSVTYGDIWNELKWNSHEVLEEQITNVVLTKFINRIDIALTKNASDLTDSDKEALGFGEGNEYSQEAFEKLKTKYGKRLVDYVVQDIYNFTFEIDDYWDNFKSLKHSDIDLLEAKYVDEIYTNYLVDSFSDNTSILTAIKNASYENYEALYDTYLKLGKELSQVYYPLLAKELLAYDQLKADIDEAEKDDTDPDDTQWGYYTSGQYVTKFKTEYTNGFDVSAVVINFADYNELTRTLRAFGLKFNNGKLYYIYDSKSADYDYLVDGSMHYEDYIEYYDDFKTSDLGNTRDDDGNLICAPIDSNAVLEIYIQIYNYVYGGFKEKLSSNFAFTTDVTQLNNLRKLTKEILEKYSSPDGDKTVEDLLEEAKAKLLEDNKDATYFSKKELTDNYGDSFKTYMYETLSLESSDSCFSTAGQSTTLGSTLAYKFNEYTNYKDGEEITDQTLVNFANWYKEEERSSYDIIELIKDTETYPTLMGDLLEKLMEEEITSTKISSYLSEKLDDAKVQIYNEACEISYSTEHSDYSKTVGGNGNSNVLATIEYDGKTYNLNIKQDNNDENSIKIPGKNEGFGVFDYLNAKSGSSTAVNLIAKQIVKTSENYEKTNKDRATYEKYISNILLAFANDQYSSSGYPSSIGKYNFLMLYFHNADIDQIIDDYYRVQSAQGFLLTDYSSDKLINFMKKYTDLAHDNYFSLGGTRLIVYLDLDDDGEPDDVSTWKDIKVSDYNDATDYFVSQKADITFGEVAKLLIQDMYKKLSDSTEAHSSKISSLVTEFNQTAKVDYEDNEISTERDWAKYRHLGFIVKTDTFTATNSSLDIDFNLKQRLFDYARGYGEDSNGNPTSYQYYINDTYPTCYIEPLNVTLANVEDDETIVETTDGYNLILVTSGTPNSSAKWERKDNKEGIFENIVILYNENPVVIENIYNDTDILNENQIKLYLLDYVLNGASKLSPADTASALQTYLQPVVTRFVGSETQRIILLNYIAKETNSSETNLYDVITFAEAGYNGNNGVFDKLIQMYQRIADDYIETYNDTTKTSEIFNYEEAGQTVTWWDAIKNLLKEAA